MKVLLLAGSYGEETNDSLKIHQGQLLIDWQITKLRSLKFEPFVIMDKFHSEEILKKSKLLEDCELIYDTNDEYSTFMSNVRSGLEGVVNYAFVLPVDVLCPELNVWNKLLTHYHKKGLNCEKHVIRPYCPVNGELMGGYPWLITKRGKWAVKNEEVQSLDHESILVSPVPVLSPAILSSKDARPHIIAV